MRPIRSLLLAACVALAPQLASAQVIGSNASAASTGTSFNSSSGTTSGGSSSGSGTGSDLSNSFGGSTSQLTRGASLADGAGTGGGRVLSTSNAFGRFYANPYYTGIPGTVSTTLPGGFGTELYGRNFLASTSTGGQSGINSGFTTGGGGGNAFTGSSGGVFSSQGGFGGNAGGQFGGIGSNQFGTQNRTGGQQQLATGPNVVTQVPVRIAYTASLDFDAPKMTAPQMATDLRAVLDRSSVVTSAKGIDLFTDGQVVIMRGTVASAREAQTAEGLIRLTPGVRGVKNELKIAGAPAPVPSPAP